MLASIAWVIMRTNRKRDAMYTLDDIMKMTPEEFAQNWNTNKIQESALTLIGATFVESEDDTTTNIEL